MRGFVGNLWMFASSAKTTLAANKSGERGSPAPGNVCLAGGNNYDYALFSAQAFLAGVELVNPHPISGEPPSYRKSGTPNHKKRRTPH